MEFFERLSGARMHTALYRPFSFSDYWYYSSLNSDLIFLVNRGSRFISGSFLSLLNNKSFKTRLSGIGRLTKKKINSYGLSGIIARAAGLPLDIRLQGFVKYTSLFSSLSFRSFTGGQGDCYDRFIIRAKEALESFKIILQLTSLVKINSFSQSSIKKFIIMEDLIRHFKNNVAFRGTLADKSNYMVESPKGVFITSIINTKQLEPYRLSFRSPVAANMNLITNFSNKITFADFVATFCSIDVVLGEIDR